MKNGKIVLLSTLIVSMLLLASCTNGGGEGEVFQGGTQGLLLRFVDGAPPNPVYDGGAVDFDLMLQVENAGEFDIDRIHFTISGINNRDFVGTYKLQNGMQGEMRSELGRDGLAGKTKLEREVIPGDSTYVTLAEGLRYTRQLLGGGELRYTVLIDACYPYATLATSTVCLQRDYLDGNDNVCSPKTGGQASVSGAPLQVTSFTQTAVGRDRLRVQYVFELKSNAQIWAPKIGQTCDPSSRTARIREEGVFYVEIDDQGAALPGGVNCIGFRDGSDFDGTHIRNINQVALGGTGNAILVQRIDPKDSGYLKLVDGRATLTCTMNLGSSATNSLGTVNIMAAYYVQDSARTTFSVTHSGEEYQGGTPTSPTTPSGTTETESSTHTLTVRKSGSGSGTVSATSGANIECGTECFSRTTQVTRNAEVILEPVADSNSRLEYWSGCDRIRFPQQCIISQMTSDKTITAHFELLS